MPDAQTAGSSPLRAILFDLDGTLVDTAPAIAAALNEVLSRRGFPAIDLPQVRAWVSLGAPELVRLALGAAAGETENDVAEFRDVLRSRPTPADALYPGVRDILAVLTQAGSALAVVTNKPEGLARRLLADLGLLEGFVSVVGGDTTPHPKPHPAPLLAALSTMEVPPDRAIYVGDSAVDFDAAAALSIPFYLYLNGYGAAECADRKVFRSFTHHHELADILVTTAEARVC